MKLYRICTENINRDKVESIVNSYVDGFTILEGTGYWKGERESSLVIEIAAEQSYMHAVVRHIARDIKAENAQQAVLVQSFEGESELI
jgi:hypothetical protein